MGLLSKALKTAVKAADAAKDASRTKPKSQMNPLVKARKKPVETDFDKSASQEVKDFLAAVEEKDPNQLGEFYSPVINTLKEMPIGKQGTKGENISAFLNKRAPNVESSERASFGLKLDPQRKYTREEVIDIAKGDGSEEYTISKINPSDNPMAYSEYKGMQRQNVKDKEEEYFVLTVDSTKYLDAAGTKVHFGKPETNLGHTRSSIRIETPAGGPLTKKIKDRERYILVEELQSDVAIGYGKLKKANKKGKAPTSPDVESIDNIVDQNIEIALEELEFDVDVGLTIPNSKIINAIKQAHINMHKNNINRFEAGEDLARLLKTEYGINFKGRAEIDAVSKNAIFNSLETADGIKYGRDSLDVDDTIDGLFDDIETEIQASKQQQKAYEQQQKGLPINPPIETRSDYVKKLILANINYAKRNNINKIVVPDYKEIARQRINTFDYAMDQADDSNPTAIKNAEIYNDFENGKITQDEYNIKYNKLAKEYFESIFKKTYEDALKKVLNNLKAETKGAIKIGTRKLEYPAAGNFKGRTSTATEIDITDFDFDPETQALRFNMGGVVPPKNYAEGGVVSMNNQTQQAFALGGLNDEGGEIDEASGNRVPIGGTKEGVRDDIPANVSEGEFIFPADVVRYHGLDKMMALRQEAKMGLKQMERMGQMGNSEEATMPDDLPFGMADLIVVGGEGEPMEFAEGGFVPQMQTLQTAPVPTMGGGTSTGTQTPIVYDDFMKTPVVTMQEYRDANGNSIIITSVNGKATTEIPAGYTLYTPPTNAAPTATQAAIQTANNYSYQTSGGGDEGSDTPRELQVDPDYASMDNDTYFSTMERQNSFGGKAGNAAAMGIALAMGPLGLLTMGMLQADKRRQLAAAEQRIAAETDPTKKKAYQATFAKMGGKTKEPEEENALVKFGKGFVAAVGGLFGLGNNDVEKVASVAASAAADNTNAPAAEQAPTAAVDAGRVPAFKRGAEAFAKGQPVSSEVVGAEETGADPRKIQDTYKGENLRPNIRSERPGPDFDAVPVIQTEAQRATEFNKQNNKVSKDQILNNPPKAELSLQPVPEVNLNLVDQAASQPIITRQPISRNSTLQQTQRPLTEPSGGMDDTAAIQAGMKPIAQTNMQMGIDPKNIYPTEEQINLRGNVYNTNAQYRQMMGDASDPRYMAEKMSEVFVPNTFTLPQAGPYKNMTSFLGEKYPISTQAAMDAAMDAATQRGTFQPDYTTGAQTDALLGPQTDYGRRIASAKGDNFIPQSNVDVAGLSDYVPNSIKNAFTSRVAPSLDKGQAKANEILQRQAMEFGPQLPTTPRADPVAPASTGYGNLIPSERTSDFRGSMDVKDYRGSAFPNLADTRQGIPINYVEPVSQPSLAPMATSPSFGTEQRPVGQDFDQADPRETINPDPMNEAARVSNISTGEQSQLTLSPSLQRYRDTMATAGGFKSSVEDQTKSIFDTDYVDPYAGDIVPTDTVSQTTTTTPETKTIIDDQTRRQQSQKNIKAKTKPSTAASTSKGTRKAAPTGDDRRSEPNFLERAFGIEPAKISARRGNDGVLYRTQADKREADNRQLQSEQIRMGSERRKYTDSAASRGQSKEQARLEYNARPENAKYISTKHGGDKEPSSKIVCSAMNNAYGFGSFRNKIWLEHSKNNLTKEHQVGYHRMFLPLIHLGYNKDYKFIRKCLEHIARHRTADIYFQSKSNKRDTLGMVYRTILEPICYLVGMFPTSKDNK